MKDGVPHRTTTLSSDDKKKLELWKMAKIIDKPGARDVAIFPFELTGYPYGLRDSDISLVDVAAIMSEFGLPTEAVTFVLTMLKSVDRFGLKTGDVLICDCLTYMIENEAFFDPFGEGTGVRADFPTELGSESVFPYSDGLAKVEVVRFGEVDLGIVADSRFSAVKTMVKQLLLQPYVYGLSIVDQVSEYGDVHKLVDIFARQTFPAVDPFAQDWDYERTHNGAHQPGATWGDVNGQMDDALSTLVRNLNIVNPGLKARVEKVQLSYPAAKLPENDMVVRGSEFSYSTVVLVYTVDGKEYARMLQPSNNSLLVEYMVQRQ